MKEYKEFKDQDEMYKVITFWSNCCGDLHHNGEYDVSEEQLPEELQRAYRELWEEGNGCLEYLLEYGGRYYVALSAEFDGDYADMLGLSMDELYAVGKCNALKLYCTDLFKDTLLLMAKKPLDGDCHEFIFLVPAMESKEVYDEIEKEISEKSGMSRRKLWIREDSNKSLKGEWETVPSFSACKQTMYTVYFKN